MPERPHRRWLALLPLVGLGLGLGGPGLLLLSAERARAAAEAAPDLPRRLELRAEARARLSTVASLPPWRGMARERLATLEAQDEAELLEHSRTLAAGVLGQQAHLAWLDERLARGAPEDLALALRHLPALYRYGEEERLRALAARLGGPQAEDWQTRAGLWSGRLPDLPPDRLQEAPGLLLHRRGPPLPEAAARPLAALVQAEQARRAGQPARGRAALYELMESADPVLAGAASWSLGQGLLDERRAGVPGLSLVGSGADRDEAALARLQAALLRSPDDEPAWAAAWFVLAELHAEEGRSEAAQEAIWAGLETALPLLAPPLNELGGPPRLDERAALHPDRLGPARRLVSEARVAALAGGQPAEALALAESSLLVLQARGLLALGETAQAEARLERADALVPASPAITAWRVRVALAAMDPKGAGEALARLPELPHTDEDDALREATRVLLAAKPSSRVLAPARALRTLLREGASPDAIKALWQAHPDRRDELRLALRSPPDDGADPAQALAQALLLQALDPAPQGTETPPEAALPDAARLDRLRELAGSEPLWALFGLHAFRLPPPEEAPPRESPPLSPPPSPDTPAP